jgi:hypothetical protein
VGDQSVGWIVRRDADRDTVADDDPDLELFHFARDAGGNGHAVIESHDVVATPGDVSNLTFELNEIFARHEAPWKKAVAFDSTRKGHRN